MAECHRSYRGLLGKQFNDEGEQWVIYTVQLRYEPNAQGNRIMVFYHRVGQSATEQNFENVCERTPLRELKSYAGVAIVPSREVGRQLVVGLPATRNELFNTRCMHPAAREFQATAFGNEQDLQAAQAVHAAFFVTNLTPGGPCELAAKMWIKDLMDILTKLGALMQRQLLEEAPKATKARNGLAPFTARTPDIELTATQAAWLRKLLVVSGFGAAGGNGQYTPSTAGAVDLLLGPEVNRDGLNPFRRVFYYTRDQLEAFSKTLRRGRIETDSISCFTDLNRASDRAIYAHADAELGAAARQDGRMFPAWRLRQDMEDQWVSATPPDPRVRAFAVLKPERPFVFTLRAKRPSKATAGDPFKYGAFVSVKFDWQCHTRNLGNSKACRGRGVATFPLFRSI